ILVAEVPGGVDVWIADRVTGKLVQRTVTADDPSTVAIRAVELLRASLLEERSPHPSRGEVEADRTVHAIVDADRPPPPAPRAAVAAPRVPAAVSPGPHAAPVRIATNGVALGPGLLWSAGGLPAIAVLDVSGHVTVLPRLGISAFVTIPLGSAERTGPEGVRRARPALAGLGARVPLAPQEAAWLPLVDAGFSAAWAPATGSC